MRSARTVSVCAGRGRLRISDRGWGGESLDYVMLI